MTITLIPDGQVADRHIAVPDPLTANRSSKYRVSLLSRDNAPMGSLNGVAGGSLSWVANAAVKGSGRITVVDTGQAIDWLNVRIKPSLVIDGLDPIPLGIFLPSSPVEKWEGEGRTWDVELLDRSTVLQQDCVEKSYALPEGTVITTAVKNLIVSAGEVASSVESFSDTLSSGMTWPPGTSKLKIINELLDAGDFFSLIVDNNGHFKVQKYKAPKNRPTTYQMLDGSKSIFTPDFEIDSDIYAVPNRVIAVAQGSGSDEALVSVAENTNPNSPFSYSRRGRWITDTVTGVEATTQDALDSYANRRLAQLMAPAMQVEINHAPVPNWDVNDVVRFRRLPADVDSKFTITKTTISLDPTDLAKTTLTEVVDL